MNRKIQAGKARLSAPAGKPLERDEHLEELLSGLPEDAPIQDYFRVVVEWRRESAMRRREDERSAPSAVVGIA